MITYQCPCCKDLLKAPPDQGGKKVLCPNCQQKILIPTPQLKTMLGEIVEHALPAAERAEANGQADEPAPVRKKKKKKKKRAQTADADDAHDEEDEEEDEPQGWTRTILITLFLLAAAAVVGVSAWIGLREKPAVREYKEAMRHFCKEARSATNLVDPNLFEYRDAVARVQEASSRLPDEPAGFEGWNNHARQILRSMQDRRELLVDVLIDRRPPPPDWRTWLDSNVANQKRMIREIEDVVK